VALLAVCFMPASWVAFSPNLKMEWYISQKCELTFTRLHGVMSQKTEIFIVSAVDIFPWRPTGSAYYMGIQYSQESISNLLMDQHVNTILACFFYPMGYSIVINTSVATNVSTFNTDSDINHHCRMKWRQTSVRQVGIDGWGNIDVNDKKTKRTYVKCHIESQTGIDWPWNSVKCYIIHIRNLCSWVLIHSK
jgi:hypothetical protein